MDEGAVRDGAERGSDTGDECPDNEFAELDETVANVGDVGDDSGVFVESENRPREITRQKKIFKILQRRDERFVDPFPCGGGSVTHAEKEINETRVFLEREDRAREITLADNVESIRNAGDE